MDFRLNSEQELLRESARRYIDAERTVGPFRAAAEPGDWRHFAESGWLAMPIAQQAGGLGSSLEDIAVLCEEMGRGLVRTPFIGGAVLPAKLVGACVATERRDVVLAAMAEGSQRFAVAVFEPERRFDLQPATRARALPDGSYRISGTKTLVSGGAQADRLVVSACLGPEAGGVALFSIDVAAPGVRRRIYNTLDDVEVADFVLEDVAVDVVDCLANADIGLAILEQTLEVATVCLCSETLGGLDQAIRLTAEYLRVRRQFGKALADFQVLQHAMAEMFMDANAARSMVYRAIAAMEGPAAERRRAVAGCHIKVMQAAKSVTGAAVHLHGGIGVTCEYPVGHYLRRAIVSERMFGDREYQLARYLDPET